MLVWRSEATPRVSRQAHALRSLVIRDVILLYVGDTEATITVMRHKIVILFENLDILLKLWYNNYATQI